MIYTGTFKTKDNKHTYTVTIGNIGVTETITDPLDSTIYEGDDLVVMFDPDPVTITADRQDLQKRVIISQATINLITNANLGEDLFANNNREIPVTVTCEGNTVFFGYVDPLQFNQGWAYKWENIQVNCTDPLGALEETYVGQLSGVDKSSTLTTIGFITKIFQHIGINVIDVAGIDSTVMNAINNTNIKLWNFFGDSDDDWMTLSECLDEIFKYFNLYAIYYDQAVHITCTINNNPLPIALESFKKAAADSSTSISTDDVYSQAMVTCEIEPVDDLIVSIDDNDYITNLGNFKRSEQYMTEYISEGDASYYEFKQLVTGVGTTWERAYTIPNYVQMLKNEAWDFGPNGYDKQTFATQTDYLRWLRKYSGKGALLGFGRGNKANLRDNSVQGNPEISPYFLISVNGTNNKTDKGGTIMENMIQAANPVCTYKGLSSAILSPSDPSVTNYIVISGKILLNPLQQLTGPNWDNDTEKISNDWESVINSYGKASWAFFELGADGKYRTSTILEHTVPYNCEEGWAYYQQQWTGNTSGDISGYGVYGDLKNEKNKSLEYKYSSIGNETDTISKLPIIACQLCVGDEPKEGETDMRKYCVERLDLGEEGWGVFEWLTMEQVNQLGIQPYFTLGTNPKMDDFIIGQSAEISRNVAGINGTAIPIKASDQLAGNIEFKILGPYNVYWTNIDKSVHSHWIFWKKTSWSEESVPVLQCISSIMISNLKIDTETDNANLSEFAQQADNDLVYYSNYNKAYIEKLEEDLKICTPLTMDECQEFGVKYQISDSYVYDTDNKPFWGFGQGEPGTDEIRPYNVYIKPEECLVDYYYKEYNKPAKIIETKLKADALSTWCLYGQKNSDLMINNYITGLTLSGNYRIMQYEADLKDETIDYTFREHRTIENNQI